MASMQVTSRPSYNMPTKAVDIATVEVLVPAVTDVNLQDLFESWDGEMPEDSTSMVPFIEQRQFLLLDELVAAYVLLRIPVLNEHDLKSYLSRLSITVEARAVGQQIHKATEHGTSQVVRDVTETIATENVVISHDPLICATEIVPEGASADTDPIRHIYLFWRLTMLIGRPRIRCSKPSIFLNPIAVLKPSFKPVAEDTDDDYLPSGVPASLNLLGPLSGDSSFAGSSPHLSASRLYKTVAKARTPMPTTQTIKTGARRLFRAAPLFLWRIRFLKSASLADKDAMLACFDIEITQFAGCDVSLDQIDLRLSSGSYQTIAADLPQRCRPAEQLTYIYKLVGSFSAVGNGKIPLATTLAISLSATAIISEECNPRVKLLWETTLSQPTSRPVSMTGQIESMVLPTRHTITEGIPAPGLDGVPGSGSMEASLSSGISLTITGSQHVRVNETFTWEVIVVNRSDILQRLAIIPIVQSRASDVHESVDQSYAASRREAPKNVLEHPIIDENVLYSVQKNNNHETTDVICLTPDVRIGSLGPSSCYVAHLKFLPLIPGPLRLHALRLVDLTTQQTTDIIQLPSIIAKIKG